MSLSYCNRRRLGATLELSAIEIHGAQEGVLSVGVLSFWGFIEDAKTAFSYLKNKTSGVGLEFLVRCGPRWLSPPQWSPPRKLAPL